MVYYYLGITIITIIIIITIIGFNFNTVEIRSNIQKYILTILDKLCKFAYFFNILNQKKIFNLCNFFEMENITLIKLTYYTLKYL